MPVTLSNCYPSLRDRLVLISGGASGIGASMVEAFCQQKARVAFLDVQDDAAQNLISKVGSQSDISPPHYYHCDLRDIEHLQSTIALLRQDLGPVAVLINNAANDDRHDFREVSVDYWDERMSVNLRHYFFAAQAVYDDMKLTGGSIINLGSMSWHAGQAAIPAYTCAKAGVEGLTRGLARDMGPDNIRVNTIVPGWVMTDRQLATRVDDKASRTISEAQCLKAQLRPEDIAAMALFLASDDSRMCSSQNFVVDGGWI